MHDHSDPASASDPAQTGPTGGRAARARSAGMIELESIAQCAAAGDEPAWEELQRRLRGALRKVFAQRVGTRLDLAEDLTQRALLGLWSSLRKGSYDSERATITTFAYAVASKVWLQHRRASGRADAAVERYTRLVLLPRGVDPGEADDTQHAGLLQAMRDAIARPREEGSPLSDDERWLMRCWAGGESDRALARRLGIAASNVNARKQVIYAKLREYFRSQGLREE